VNLTNFLRILAWLLLAGVVFATLSPINLRPESPLPTSLERIIALMLIGFVFALAYPRRTWLVVAIVLGSTIILELLQLTSPTRHGRLVDVAVKLGGASIGLAMGRFALRLRAGRPTH
jgi:VanZ family protein